MSLALLERQIHEAQLRLRAIAERVETTPAQHAMVSDALQEFAGIFQELQNTSTEVQAQAEELAASRATLEAEHQRYQELFDFAPDGYLITNHEGVIHEANLAAEALLHMSRDSLIGTPLSAFSPSQEQHLLTSLLHELQRRKCAKESEICIQPRDGEVFPAAVRVTVARDRADKLVKLRWLIRDISARKKLESRLHQSERMAAIGHMAAGLVHESRNALQQIQGPLEMLGRRLKGTPEERFVTEIQKAEDRLHRLLEDLRYYTTPVQLCPKPVNLSEIWLAAWNWLRPKFQSRAVTFNDVSEDSIVCQVDPGLMEHAFRSILEYFLGASFEPMSIEVSQMITKLEGRPAIGVSVRATGSKLNCQLHKRAFEPFETGHTNGTGLGMAVAKRLIESHGGCIALSQNTGPVAEIIIRIPRGSEGIEPSIPE